MFVFYQNMYVFIFSDDSPKWNRPTAEEVLQGNYFESICSLRYKSFTIVSYDLNDSVQWYKTFYHHKLQNFVMS